MNLDSTIAETVTHDDRSQDRILVVDDEAGIRMILKDFLESLDLEVLEAIDGNAATTVCEEQDLDLVITDIHMPGKSGMDLLRDLHESQPELPVLIITGQPSVQAAVECIRTGALDFITKPFDLVQIGERVQEALADRHRLAEDTRAGDVVPGNAPSTSSSPKGYKVVRPIGQGNMGTVYLARHDPEDGQEYAMKVLRSTDMGEAQRQSVLERFRREAEAARMVDHPNVVKIYDYGHHEEEQSPFIVMELLKGKSLKFLISRGELKKRQKLSILRQVGDALGAIHDVGVCHRDVKPSNILVNEQLEVKLTDFGIARLPESELTMTTSFVGSPAYMSPEAFVSAKVDYRADLFGFGIMCYELLLGRKPFQGENLPQIMNAIRNQEPPRPESLKPDLDPRLIAMLDNLLQKDPLARYEHIRQAVDILSAVLDA